MVNKTVITVGIDRRPWGPGRSDNRGPFAVGFTQVAPRGVLSPWVEYLPTLAGTSRRCPTWANQNSSAKGGGTTCSHMTISRINPFGRLRPQLWQKSGSRGAGGSVSFLMTTGPFHQSRQMEQGAAPTACSSFFRRLLSDILRFHK